jgi:phosphatidylserine decarboxylase
VIHREGYTLILATLILCGVGAWSVHRYLTSPTWLAWIAYLLLGVITVLVVQFFRNPQRNTVLDPQRIIAPADGQVVIIEKVREPEYFGDERLQISIFMSPINVHVNRNPVSGVVSYFRYHPGDYLVAWHPKSSTLNERTTVVVGGPTTDKRFYFVKLPGPWPAEFVGMSLKAIRLSRVMSLVSSSLGAGWMFTCPLGPNPWSVLAKK